ncbi:hypothetical protein VCUG_00430 [Vavraia culicis subsp. floridensis]|uniref:J domain-containing protein n=1 Tax=Vavraia culicis (isolate floridensis) TaxID=948595 RepID=L2GXD1_VAVCU|nr:uncharacterized protein VCUG_00430 [Vavraia culicis subsp. floridensis]ELA48007.1 hypothetical protein VCUG_00430 [Vavraia culicis subsp. floridensis]
MLPSQNYFTLLNLPHTFFIDKQRLKHNYYTQAKRYHPSMMGGSEHIFVGLKKAYDTLNDDLQRALYLHRVHGANANGSDTHATNVVKKGATDRTDDEHQHGSDTNRKGMNDLAHLYELSERLSTNDGDAKKELADRIDECKKFYYDPVYLGRWKYYERMKERMKEKEIDDAVR